MKLEKSDNHLTRRQWLTVGLAGGVVAVSAATIIRSLRNQTCQSATAILRAPDYSMDLRPILRQGFQELGITREGIRGKKILLKPNLVEVERSAPHINTHPALVRATADVFMELGAACVVVAEGSGHCLDTILVFENSGLRQALAGGSYRFVDLNQQDPLIVKKAVNFSMLPFLAFPAILRDMDWIVSMPKMKTHHWAGVTLSMKNLFGMMPGSYYGWPKNRLHQAGINGSIADIALTLQPQLAIVDGIVGMEGDGPIMGTAIQSGVIVMGQTLPAVDATCARLMDIDPDRVPVLKMARQVGFQLDEKSIEQRGESIVSQKKPFKLLAHIPAQKELMLNPAP